MNRPSTWQTIVFIVAMLTTACVSSNPLTAASAGKISKEDLKTILDDPDVVILDVRTGKDWSSSEFKIKGAVRANPREFDSWATAYPKTKKIVLYCA